LSEIIDGGLISLFMITVFIITNLQNLFKLSMFILLLKILSLLQSQHKPNSLGYVIPENS